MLLDFNNTQIKITCQQYICTEFRFDNNCSELWMDFKSQQDTKDVCCEYCGNNDVEIHDNYTTKLTDMPIWSGIRQFLTVTYHKYKCRHCNKVFNEDICFKDPDARVTTRAAVWAKDLLKHGICIRTLILFYFDEMSIKAFPRLSRSLRERSPGVLTLPVKRSRSFL